MPTLQIDHSSAHTRAGVDADPAPTDLTAFVPDDAGTAGQPHAGGAGRHDGGSAGDRTLPRVVRERPSALRRLLRDGRFRVAAPLLLVLAALAAAPGLFTRVDPQACDLAQSLGPPQVGHPFGFDLRGVRTGDHERQGRLGAVA